eukprot:1159308-Pelagomonas_calceolata.AAC.6
MEIMNPRAGTPTEEQLRRVEKDLAAANKCVGWAGTWLLQEGWVGVERWLLAVAHSVEVATKEGRQG